MLSNDEWVILPRGNDFRVVVLRDLFSMYETKIPVRDRTKKKTALKDSADIVSYSFLKALTKKNFLSKIDSFKPVYKDKIRPLFLFLDKEILLYAKLKGLKFTLRENSFREKEFIDTLEGEHPEIKQSIVRTISKI